MISTSFINTNQRAPYNTAMTPWLWWPNISRGKFQNFVISSKKWTRFLLSLTKTLKPSMIWPFSSAISKPLPRLGYLGGSNPSKTLSLVKIEKCSYFLVTLNQEIFILSTVQRKSLFALSFTICSSKTISIHTDITNGFFLKWNPNGKWS